MSYVTGLPRNAKLENLRTYSISDKVLASAKLPARWYVTQRSKKYLKLRSEGLDFSGIEARKSALLRTTTI